MSEAAEVLETADPNRLLRIHSLVEHFKDIETVLGRNLTGGARFAAHARKREVRAESFARNAGEYAPFAMAIVSIGRFE